MYLGIYNSCRREWSRVEVREETGEHYDNNGGVGHVKRLYSYPGNN